MKGKIKIKAFALFYMKAYACTDNCKSCRIKLGMQTCFSEVRSRVIVSAKVANIITVSLFRANFCRVIFLTLWGFFASESICKPSERKQKSPGPSECSVEGCGVSSALPSRSCLC